MRIKRFNENKEEAFKLEISISEEVINDIINRLIYTEEEREELTKIMSDEPFKKEWMESFISGYLNSSLKRIHELLIYRNDCKEISDNIKEEYYKMYPERRESEKFNF